MFKVKETKMMDPKMLLGVVNQKVASLMLKKFNIVVDIANNGQEAINKVCQNDYDLILMDCQMPVLDGYSATRKIRTLDNKKKNIPIIAMTAHAMKGDREKCLDAGMDDYITKPVKSDILQSILLKWLKYRGRRS